jgi:glycerol uptake facilitator-like aquaporin
MMDSLVVEFLGTALLISSGVFGGPLLVIAALAVAIYFGGNISGAHFNPAVRFFKYLCGNIGRTKALYYVTAQYSASLLIFFLMSM